MKRAALMVQGTGSDVGKSVEAALDALADCLAEALDVRGMLADAGLRGGF